ncbi:hypothetical protein PTTG_28326 [Puccinia triticina 1-1 BBBD Race 1]|uniref:Uncharacterized protein n=2 Tax=Puccinia triticina TaxID=208348 RepID=A0A180GCR5_PUCT1|nr:uncharacterized protein PtA15_5A775 [Puccinia triticina]OAV90450.1 hypothetical protein PTTG_28326 [Puccinia triticina 1-1 BBBD Race 1]WAQ85201.1 hypothetical protein PtA15_5A775 [Puccinia triticina]WAR58534.1 hypothetical protein PtB15_5B768 [Puccinia triticina]
MRACDLFIRLLSLSALVIGVCSMVDAGHEEVFEHIWTRRSGIKSQKFGNSMIKTGVSVNYLPGIREEGDYGIHVNNPLEVPVKVRVTVNPMDDDDDPLPITEHTIQPNPNTPWSERHVRTLVKLPRTVEVQYSITDADAEKLLGPLSERQESIEEFSHSEEASPSHE